MTAKSTQPQLTAEQVLKVLDDEVASLPQISRMVGLKGVSVDPSEAIERMTAARTAVAQIIAERDAMRRAMAELEAEWDKVYRAKDEFEPCVRMDRLERILAINQIRKRAAALTGTEE